MSTRAQIKFATRESGVPFDQIPDVIHGNFYCHSDGYPEGLGLDIARSLYGSPFKISGWEIESLTAKHGDLEYIYVIWQTPGKSTYISAFEWRFPRECDACGKYDDGNWVCIFVGEPDRFIEKYSFPGEHIK